jgi:hypothetical protein
MAARKNRVITDRDEIQQWAEERGGRPARGGAGLGIIRLDFGGTPASEDELSWDEWFDRFDEGNLALVIDDTSTGGGLSNVHKLVSREAARTGRPRAATRGRRRAAGTPARRAAQPRRKAASSTRGRGRATTGRGRGAKQTGSARAAGARGGRAATRKRTAGRGRASSRGR